LGIGDWGLGIGPIPNPQSPRNFNYLSKIIILYIILVYNNEKYIYNFYNCYNKLFILNNNNNIYLLLLDS